MRQRGVSGPLGAAGARAAAKGVKEISQQLEQSLPMPPTNHSTQPDHCSAGHASFLTKRVLVVVPGAGFRVAAVRSIGPFLG